MEIKPNEQQQKAINHIDGPVMLLAGPGTGKTYTALAAIADLYAAKSRNLAVIIICPYQHLGQ